MAKNSILITVIVALVVGAAGFFGGMQYQKSQPLVRPNNGAQRFARQNGANAVRGEILSASDSNITVKLTDGSSKIVILSGSTTISEATMAAKSVLQAGKQVMVFGTTNTDGSVTAQNIQLGTFGRPGN